MRTLARKLLVVTVASARAISIESRESATPRSSWKGRGWKPIVPSMDKIGPITGRLLPASIVTVTSTRSLPGIKVISPLRPVRKRPVWPMGNPGSQLAPARTASSRRVSIKTGDWRLETRDWEMGSAVSSLQSPVAICCSPAAIAITVWPCVLAKMVTPAVIVQVRPSEPGTFFLPMLGMERLPSAMIWKPSPTGTSEPVRLISKPLVVLMVGRLILPVPKRTPPLSIRVGTASPADSPPNSLGICKAGLVMWRCGRSLL